MVSLKLENIPFVSEIGGGFDREAETGQALFLQEHFLSETKCPLLARAIAPWIEVAVLVASAIICFGAALTTSVKSEDYGLLLTAISCVVGAFSARKVIGVRDQTEVPTWLTFRWRADAESDKLEDRRTKFQAQEMAVDIYRAVALIVIVPLVLFRVYQMAGQGGNLFETKGIVTLVATSGLVLYLYVRVGTDECAPPKDPAMYDRAVWVSGMVGSALALACYVLILIDGLNAADKSSLKSKTGSQFVLYCSIGPVVMFVLTLFLRQCPPGNTVTYSAAKEGASKTRNVNAGKIGDNGYNEFLSIAKDVVHCAFTVLILGFLAFGSAFDVLGQPFNGTTFFR